MDYKPTDTAADRSARRDKDGPSAPPLPTSPINYADRVARERQEKIEADRDLVRRYKSEIDMVQYLGSMGYVPDKESYSRKWPVMQESTLPGARKLIIGRNGGTGEYYYFNPADTKDKGTIVELASQFKQLDLSTRDGWNDLHRYLGGYIGNPYFSQHDNIRPQRVNEMSREQAVVQHFRLDPLTNTDYLTQHRKISEATILAPEFNGKIFNKPYTKEDGTKGINTVFPIENEHGMLGTINRSADPAMKRGLIYGSKGDGVWLSNVNAGQSPKELFIVENPIDALSHHQLMPPGKPFERLYVATAGSISNAQYATLQNLINQFHPERLVLGFDNDNAGIRYNVNMIGKLLMPGQPAPAVDLVIGASKMTNTLYIDLKADAVGRAIVPTTVDALVGQVNKVMNKGYAKEDQKTDIEIITKRDDLVQLRVTFPNLRPLLIRSEQLAKELRGVGNELQVARSLEKDWNDELKKIVEKQQLRADAKTGQAANSVIPVNVPRATAPDRSGPRP